MTDERKYKSLKKYRLAMLEDTTLREVFHIRMSALGAFTTLSVLFLLLIIALSLLIIFTPIRNILPGYSESIRQQLIEESARVDSLQTDLTLQRQYLDVIKQLTAGEIKSDTVQPLDSLQIIQRAQLLEERNAATDEFVAQYEQKERDQLLLFDPQRINQAHATVRPVRGAVLRSADISRREYGVILRVAKNESVAALMRGTIVSVERTVDNTYTVVLQQNQYTTLYRHVSEALKQPGAHVEPGEAIGLMDGEQNLEIQMWDNGKPVNPEEVISWR